MKKIEINDIILSTIKTFQKAGYDILFIDYTFFITTEFIPADNEMQNFSLIRGLDVTKKIMAATHVGISEIAIISVKQAIQEMKDNNEYERRQYSSSYTWIWYCH